MTHELLLTRHANATDFLAVMQAAFERDEAASGLIYGVCRRMVERPERIEAPPFLASVVGNGRPVAAAMMTPPYNVVVWGESLERTPAIAAALMLIARELILTGAQVPGVLGASALSECFAQSWQALTGAAVRLGMRERIYELRRVVWPSPAPGKLRVATVADLALIADWFWAFTVEAGLTSEQDRARQSAEYSVRDGGMFVWYVDGEIVSMAGRGRSTPHGGTVGPVYTPPQHRGKGYASNLTAALSQLVLDSGKDFATLFTDLANPTSNGIYMKIGYVARCDFNEWKFG